jgi:hypothetical protein
MKTIGMLFILFCEVNLFAQEGNVDTVYTTSHKITYVIDTTGTTSIAGKNTTEQSPAPKDTFGMSAPPNCYNRLSVDLIAQGLFFVVTYEHLFAPFWAGALRISYQNIDEKDMRRYTSAEGSVKNLAMPFMLRLYWGRRNMGAIKNIDAKGNQQVTRRSQAEAFLQIYVQPSANFVDISQDSSYGQKAIKINDTEFGAVLALGFGTKYIGERLFLGAEINVGKYIKDPEFKENIAVSDNSDYSLLNDVFLESILSVGVQF